MTRKRYKKQKPKVSNPNSRYRKLMRYVEPKVFYEDNYFSPDAPDADTWRECWIAEKVMLGLAGIAAYFHIWWLLPILFFPISMAWTWRGTIDSKAGNAYPGLEVGDAMGIALMAMICGVISFIWFVRAIF